METINILIAYSSEDEAFKERLKSSLKILTQSANVRLWDEMDIQAGQVVNEELNKQLLKADIIVLLISRDSLGSDSFNGDYMEKALMRHSIAEAVVVPVLLKPSAIKFSRLKLLKCLPPNNVPITQWGDPEAAILVVTESLQAIIQSYGLQKNHTRLAKEAESLFEKKSWQKAREIFQQLFDHSQPNFTPTSKELQKKILECDVQIDFEQKAAALKEKQKTDHNAIIHIAEDFWARQVWDKSALAFDEAVMNWSPDFETNVSYLKERSAEAWENHQNTEKARQEQTVQVLPQVSARAPEIPNKVQQENPKPGIWPFLTSKFAAFQRPFFMGIIAACFVTFLWLVIPKRSIKPAQSRDETAILAARKANSIDKWNSFTRDYPDSKYKDEAQRSTRQLLNLEKLKYWITTQHYDYINLLIDKEIANHPEEAPYYENLRKNNFAALKTLTQ